MESILELGAFTASSSSVHLLQLPLEHSSPPFSPGLQSILPSRATQLPSSPAPSDTLVSSIGPGPFPGTLPLPQTSLSASCTSNHSFSVALLLNL